nr:MAG TPA: hypothetical protein [Caudoviricetes sp.]
MSENVYKDLYESRKEVENLQNILFTVAKRLQRATGLEDDKATLEALLHAVDVQFGVETEEAAEESAESE